MAGQSSVMANNERRAALEALAASRERGERTGRAVLLVEGQPAREATTAGGRFDRVCSSNNTFKINQV
jgi:hypothetical protein